MRGRVIVYRNREAGLVQQRGGAVSRPIRHIRLVRVFWYLLHARRIRLAAYGARLERVLG